MARSRIWTSRLDGRKRIVVRTEGEPMREARHVRIHGPAHVDVDGVITTRARLTLDAETLNPPIDVPTGRT